MYADDQFDDENVLLLALSARSDPGHFVVIALGKKTLSQLHGARQIAFFAAGHTARRGISAADFGVVEGDKATLFA